MSLQRFKICQEHGVMMDDGTGVVETPDIQDNITKEMSGALGVGSRSRSRSMILTRWSSEVLYIGKWRKSSNTGLRWSTNAITVAQFPEASRDSSQRLSGTDPSGLLGQIPETCWESTSPPFYIILIFDISREYEMTKFISVYHHNFS